MTKTELTTIPPEYDKVVICVGRKYNTDGIGLEKLDINQDRGKILVDENLKTNLPGIYAIGDVVGGYLLAHVASHEGIVACDNIMGKKTKMDYRSVPLCIYTDPQISSVGLTQEEAKEKGHSIKVSKFPFRSIGKSHVINETEGFIKIVGDDKNSEVLGIHIVGSQAALLIAEATAIVKNRMKIDQLTELIHAHPTLSEAFMEAAFLFKGTPVHST